MLGRALERESGLTKEVEKALAFKPPPMQPSLPVQLNTVPCYACQCYGRA
jgi:hypothetical protein